MLMIFSVNVHDIKCVEVLWTHQLWTSTKYAVVIAAMWPFALIELTRFATVRIPPFSSLSYLMQMVMTSFLVWGNVLHHQK